MSILLELVAAIDLGIYSLVAKLFDLIFAIAKVDFFADGIIDDVKKKIYVILSIVVIFKITIACIQYLINPDSFSDKEKGMGGILKRVAFSLLLIVIVPVLFEFVKNETVQDTLQEALPKIILNKSIDDSKKQEAGDMLARITLLTFVETKPDKGGSDPIVNNNAWTLQGFYSNVTAGCRLFNLDACKYNYKWYFSLPVGIFLLYILLSMGIDVAIRAIKFGILELVAPVCISSYIMKKDTFTKWYKMCFKVFADLYIRLTIVYLIIYFVAMIANGSVFKNFKGSDVDPLVKIFVILGVLFFAKGAPKFISDVLGLDSSGDLKDMFTPFHKKVGSIGALAAGASMATAAGANLVNGIRSSKITGSTKREKLKSAAKNIGHVTGSTLGGAASAGFHGGIAALSGKNFKETMAAGHGRAVKARQNREIDKLNGVSGFDRMLARSSDFFGIDTTASLAEGKQKAYSTVHQDTGNFKKSVMGRIEKNGMVSMRTDVKAGSAISEIGRLMEENASTIYNSGNQDLINYMNKFTRVTDSNGNDCWKLRDGEHLSYHDIAAINADATQSGIGSIASYTSERGAITLQAQKEIMLDAMVGKVKNIDGSFNSDMNVVMQDGRTINENAHTDVTTAYGQAMQHIAENALNLGEIEIDGVKYKGAKEIQEAYRANYSAVDDAVERLSGKLSSQISEDKNAAARASIQRRNDNKKS